MLDGLREGPMADTLADNPNLLGRGWGGRLLWRYRVHPVGGPSYDVVDVRTFARVAGPFRTLRCADAERDRWNGIAEGDGAP